MDSDLAYHAEDQFIDLSDHSPHSFDAYNIFPEPMDTPFLPLEHDTQLWHCKFSGQWNDIYNLDDISTSLEVLTTPPNPSTTEDDFIVVHSNGTHMLHQFDCSAVAIRNSVIPCLLAPLVSSQLDSSTNTTKSGLSARTTPIDRISSSSLSSSMSLVSFDEVMTNTLISDTRACLQGVGSIFDSWHHYRYDPNKNDPTASPEAVVSWAEAMSYDDGFEEQQKQCHGSSHKLEGLATIPSTTSSD